MLKNFINDQDVLKNTFVKKCVLCNNLNIVKNRQICNECKERDKCTEYKIHIPKPPLKFVFL